MFTGMRVVAAPAGLGASGAETWGDAHSSLCPRLACFGPLALRSPSENEHPHCRPKHEYGANRDGDAAEDGAGLFVLDGFFEVSPIVVFLVIFDFIFNFVTKANRFTEKDLEGER